MFLKTRNKSSCQQWQCTALGSGASLPENSLIKTFPIIFLSKPSMFSQRSNDLAILTPGFQLRQNFLLSWLVRPWHRSIKTISTSEIIWEIGFYIAPNLERCDSWMRQWWLTDVYLEKATQLLVVMQPGRPEAGDDYILQFYKSC